MIKVGDRVTSGMRNEFTVVSIKDGYAWCQYDSNTFFTIRLDDLKKVEPKWRITSSSGYSVSLYSIQEATRKAEDILDKYTSVTIEYNGT